MVSSLRVRQSTLDNTSSYVHSALDEICMEMCSPILTMVMDPRATQNCEWNLGPKGGSSVSTEWDGRGNEL